MNERAEFVLMTDATVLQVLSRSTYDQARSLAAVYSIGQSRRVFVAHRGDTLTRLCAYENGRVADWPGC